MSGTETGGQRAAQTNRELYGPDFYKRIGSKGGSAPTKTPKGFAYSAANGLDWHVKAGQRGGTISRIKPKPVEVAKPNLMRRIFNNGR